MMVRVIEISSSVNLSPMSCHELTNFIMFVRSSVGTFQYMFVMPNDTSLVFLSKEISSKSFINCTEFLTLNVFGNRMCSCKSLASNLANLYAGAFCQLMIGRIGELALCILGRPFMLGADGLRFMYFHFSSLRIMVVQLLVTFRISY